MLLDTNFVVALFCGSCGRMHMEKLSFFDFVKSRVHRIVCDCGNHLGKITVARKGCYEASIWCALCEDYHTESFLREDFSESYLLKLEDCCSGRKSFVGVPQAVREELLRQERFSVGKESSTDEFEDPQVMFEVLNKVDDLAVSGSICCGCCGEDDIGMEVFDDFIMLFCGHCGNMYKIRAVNRADAQKIKSMRFIELGQY